MEKPEFREPLGYLTGDDYAEEFYRVTGNWPRWIPVSGAWGLEDRKWCRFHGVKDDS